MQDAIIYIDPEKPMNLQNQIRQKLVDGILSGSFAPGIVKRESGADQAFLHKIGSGCTQLQRRGVDEDRRFYVEHR